MSYSIRPMTAADVEAAAAAVLAGGWGDRSRVLRFAVSAPGWTPYVAIDGGAIVGTGLAARQGAAGWVGLIWTAPESRGRGIGTAVTARVVEDLEAGGCRSCVLVATELGRPVYEKLGFRAIGHETMLRGPAAGLPSPAPGGPSVRVFMPADREQVAALDREATGEERDVLLAAASDGFVADDGHGRLGGFLLRSPFGSGRGTIARDVATALALHRAAGPAGSEQRFGFCALNAAGLAGLLADGWEEAGGATRMVRGPGPSWQPAMCFGDFSFATG